MLHSLPTVSMSVSSVSRSISRCPAVVCRGARPARHAVPLRADRAGTMMNTSSARCSKLRSPASRRQKCETPGQGPGASTERETGFEPATSTLARLHSTTELLPRGREAIS